MALLSKFSVYLIVQNTEHYFTRVKIKQMIINIHFTGMPAILVRKNDTRNCSLVQGFTCYCPELAKREIVPKSHVIISHRGKNNLQLFFVRNGDNCQCHLQTKYDRKLEREISFGGSLRYCHSQKFRESFSPNYSHF